MGKTSSMCMYMCMTLNRDANCFFPVDNKHCINFAPFEKVKMWARSGAQFVPIWDSGYLLDNLFAKPRKLCLLETQAA